MHLPTGEERMCLMRRERASLRVAPLISRPRGRVAVWPRGRLIAWLPGRARECVQCCPHHAAWRYPSHSATIWPS